MTLKPIFPQQWHSLNTQEILLKMLLFRLYVSSNISVNFVITAIAIQLYKFDSKQNKKKVVIILRWFKIENSLENVLVEA